MLSTHPSRRDFLKLGATGLAASALPAAPAKKPNFLIILADDMGFSDARCYGGDVDTPNLDKLAGGGLRFTQAYSTARCGPSRGCILTGRYAQQTAGDVMTPGNVPRWISFAPEYLKLLGYRSYHSGKWHIRFKPVAGAGFDHSYALLDQDRFFTPQRHLLDDQKLPAVQSNDNYYATFAIADSAVKHLKGHAGDPFFLYLAFTSPHFPLHALPEDIDLYRDRFAEGWDTARERKWQRMRRIELVMCAANFVDIHTYNFEGTVFAEAAKRGLGVVAMKILGGTEGKGPGQTAKLSAPEHYETAVRYALGIPGLSVAILGMRRLSDLQSALKIVRSEQKKFQPIAKRAARWRASAARNP